MQTYDIVVVGAGAAGLAAAIFAAETARTKNATPSIVVLDSARKVGAKILVSGGGRCNVTHDEVHPEDYNGSRNIVRNILAAFDEQATTRWFESLGVPLKREETGKLFPVSDSARTVLSALLRRCEALGVTILTAHRVIDVVRAAPPHPISLPQGEREPAIEVQGSGFIVRHEYGELVSQRVVLATGGRSLPKTGSDGSGWGIAQRLGHSVTTTVPALVPLVLTDQTFHAELSGISVPVELSTLVNGKVSDRRTGSLLWTHFGVSGPVVMDASRHWTWARANGHEVQLQCHFLPGQGFEQIEKWLISMATARPRGTLSNLLAERLPDRLARALLREAGIEPSVPLSQVSRDRRRALVHTLANFVLPVVHDRGWNFAEVTAGGVPLQEVNYRTMESRKVPGLYLVGELLDCDGRIGGFNFQWAWATGYVGGRAASS
ncbi:MAG: NAD(P)/FAD-dependent oxidoreductase [Deltaproteobacteria bacterium]|nr:NAD(P)/FAD-dependent oxidoreductase [Deltaproteobacteria bacterium]